MSQTTLMMAAGLGIEILLLLVVLLAVSFFRARARERRDLKAIKALVARAKKSKPEREKLLAQFLQQNMGLDGDALEKAKVAMLRAEMSLVQRFASVYHQREASAAARFDDDVFAVTSPYHALSGSAEHVEVPPPGHCEHEEIELLRTENQRLSDELRTTIETMSRMLSEYSTMFSGEAGGAAAPIAATAAVANDVAGESARVEDEPLSAMEDDVSIDVGVLEPDAPSDEVATSAETAPSDDEIDALLAGEGDDVVVASEVDVDDEVEAVLRAAEQQEALARGTGDAVPTASAMSDDEDAGDDGLFEEGPSEVLGFDDAELEVESDATDIDDLFDSAAATAADDQVDDIDELIEAAASTEAAPGRNAQSGG